MIFKIIGVQRMNLPSLKGLTQSSRPSNLPSPFLAFPLIVKHDRIMYSSYVPQRIEQYNLHVGSKKNLSRWEISNIMGKG